MDKPIVQHTAGRLLIVVVTILLSTGLPTWAQIDAPTFQEWTFDKDTPAAAPSGFLAHTFGKGANGEWKIEKDDKASSPSPPNILTQSASCPNPECFYLLLADNSQFKYLDLTVSLQVFNEEGAARGGLVFGAKDSQNFYAVLVDPTQKSVEMVRVLEGTTTTLGRADVTTREGPWHFLRVQRNTIVSQEIIEIFLDNQLILSLSDHAHGAGQIGIVTTGNGTIRFDSLRIMQLISNQPLSSPPAY